MRWCASCRSRAVDEGGGKAGVFLLRAGGRGCAGFFLGRRLLTVGSSALEEGQEVLRCMGRLGF